MANLNDLVQSAVMATAGKVDIPSNLKNQVLGGLSDSIMGSFTQTATKAGGLDEIKNLLTGKTDPAKSIVTDLAGNLFKNNVLNKTNLGALAPAVSGLVPSVMSQLSGMLKDQDGDGDVDINDILITLKGGSGNNVLGAAAGILGGILGRKK